MQRWHECNGLPVHHFGGHKGSVFAYEEEINQWIASLSSESGNALPGGEETVELGKRSSSGLTMTADAMWETRSERNVRAIADLYRKAIADDSCNSSAYAGLAKTIVFCAVNDIMDGSMAYPIAIEALRRMPQLDSEHLDTKCPAAWIDMLYNRNWRQARADFEEILSKRPNSFALAGMAAMHIAESRALKAQGYAWEAWRLNPLVSSLGGLLCWTVYMGEDFQQVLALVAQIRSGSGNGSFVSTVEALVLIQNGFVAENLGRIEKAASDFPLSHTLQGILGYAYGISGQTDKAQSKYTHLSHGSQTIRESNGYALAIVSMGLGNLQDAITWLEAAYAEGSLWSLGIRCDPILKPLADDPRFVRLINKIGVTTHYQVEPRFKSLPTHPFLQSALVGENT